MYTERDGEEPGRPIRAADQRNRREDPRPESAEEGASREERRSRPSAELDDGHFGDQGPAPGEQQRLETGEVVPDGTPLREHRDKLAGSRLRDHALRHRVREGVPQRLQVELPGRNQDLHQLAREQQQAQQPHRTHLRGRPAQRHRHPRDTAPLLHHLGSARVRRHERPRL